MGGPPLEQQPEKSEVAARQVVPSTALIPNLRVGRVPVSSWSVQAGELEATVRPGSSIPNPKEPLDKISWTLSVELNIRNRPWSFVSVSSQTPGVEITSPGTDSGMRRGERQIVVEVTAPRMMSVARNRIPVTLSVTYRIGNKTLTRQMEVDYQSTFGDVIDKSSISPSIAAIVERNLGDPVLDRIIDRVKEIPRGSLSQEVELLRSMLPYDQNSYLPIIEPNTDLPSNRPYFPARAYQGDPLDEAPGWTPGTAYVQSPTETSRYGGDCEDWSVFSAAYLARRGFKVWIACSPTHAWAFALDKDGRLMCVDFTSENPVSPPEELDWGQPYEDLKLGETSPWCAPVRTVPVRREQQRSD